MKKILVLVLLSLSVSACTYNLFNPPKVKELDPVEMFGTRGKVLEGRLYLATCETNAFGSAETARNTNLKKAAKTAKKKGFSYFTILDRNSFSKMKTVSYTTHENITSKTNFNAYGSDGYSVRGNVDTNYRVPVKNTFNTEFHTSKILFLLLNEDELDYWNNIYSVEKYL